MQQIEIIKLGHFRHARRQSKVVRGVVEERITGNFDLVEVNVRLWLREPDGLRVGDEMNVVAALRQLEAEFGCNHSASAVGGIARDPDLHSARLRACSFDGEFTRRIQILGGMAGHVWSLGQQSFTAEIAEKQLEALIFSRQPKKKDYLGGLGGERNALRLGRALKDVGAQGIDFIEVIL
jgi:hypothetical protein